MTRIQVDLQTHLERIGRAERTLHEKAEKIRRGDVSTEAMQALDAALDAHVKALTEDVGPRSQ